MYVEAGYLGSEDEGRELDDVCIVTEIKATVSAFEIYYELETEVNVNRAYGDVEGRPRKKDTIPDADCEVE